MAPKIEQTWEKWNHAKRKLKKKKTEQKLRKLNENHCPKACSSDAVEQKTISTISIAIPGSILDNAQSPELRSYLAGQIARAACIYQVDEIVVFNDCGTETNSNSANADEKNTFKSCEQLAAILQYLECPQYLRKHLFPIHNYLKYAGVLNPLDAPHHLRKDDVSRFREGVVLALPPKPGKGSYVDVGFIKPIIVDKVLEPYFRVTVQLKSSIEDPTQVKSGTVVSPHAPKEEAGIYWGYAVRTAKSLNEIFTKSPFIGGYDLTIGTSDKGEPVDGINFDQQYNHCLIAFGGLQGLEFALKNDNAINVDDISLLFDRYVNTCPQQTCRTIRTEEALLISLAVLYTKLKRE